MPVQQSVTLTFQDPAGNPLAGGRVELMLNSDISTVASGGVQVAARRKVVATLDNSGSATVFLWPNSLMSPADTVYFIAAFTAQGQPAWSGELSLGDIGNYLLQESGDHIVLEAGNGDLLLEI